MARSSDKKVTIGMWVLTVLFCIPMLLSSMGYFTKSDEMVKNMGALGYPLYFMTILGLAKVSGVVALLQPKFVRIKEWAYAGFSFTMIGASMSHAFNGDPVGNIVPPLVLLGVLMGSYVLWHKKLGT